MTLLELGKYKFPVWVHRGEALEKCTAIRVSINFMKRFMDSLNKAKAKFGEVKKDGTRTQLHGET